MSGVILLFSDECSKAGGYGSFRILSKEENEEIIKNLSSDPFAEDASSA